MITTCGNGYTMVKIKKLTAIEDIIEYTVIFNRAIGYSNVPWTYHASGDVYALWVDGKIRAGFVLVPGYYNLRAILQIPEEKIIAMDKTCPKLTRNMCDHCGYFINTTNFWHGVLFTFYMSVICTFYRKRYFTYTYPVHDKALEKYYANGDPMRIHSGIPVHLPGHGEDMEAEHIEVLTRWGAWKIFFYRFKRAYKARKLKKASKK